MSGFVEAASLDELSVGTGTSVTVAGLAIIRTIHAQSPDQG